MIPIKAEYHTPEIIERFGKLEDKKFLIVLDLELTCDVDMPKDEMEIIEIGFVVLSKDDYRVLGEYQTFVKPRNNPILSDYCKQLTGITQEQVDSADHLDKVLAHIEIAKLADPIYWVFVCYGSDAEHLVNEANRQVDDFNNAIPEDDEDTFPKFHFWMDPRYVNLKVFDGAKKRSLMEALRDTGIQPPETQTHRALDDAHETSILVREWKVSPMDALINKNKSYKQKIEETKLKLTDKFQKKVAKHAERKTVEKLLQYSDWDYQKAKNIFELLR